MSESHEEHDKQIQVHRRQIKRIIQRFECFSKSISVQSDQLRRIEITASMINDSIKELHLIIKGNGNQTGLELKHALLEERVEHTIERINATGLGTKAWVQLVVGAIIPGVISIITVLLMRGIK